MQRISFLCEQIGKPEQELKHYLLDLFKKNKEVIRAYLVRVKYDSKNDFNVVLCLKMTSKPSENLEEGISNIFAGMFRTDEHLDTLFLSSEEEARLRSICQPFYVYSY